MGPSAKSWRVPELNLGGLYKLRKDRVFFAFLRAYLCLVLRADLCLFCVDLCLFLRFFM